MNDSFDLEMPPRASKSAIAVAGNPPLRPFPIQPTTRCWSKRERMKILNAIINLKRQLGG